MDKLTEKYANRVKQCGAEGSGEYEAVNHPDHYNRGTIEVIDFIEDWKLDFNEGSIVKYVCRAGRKPGEAALRDLRKAEWYLDRLIKQQERNQ